MAKPYTTKQFWEIYKKLPEELKAAAASEETGDNIYNVCQKNNVEDKLGEIVEYVGAVLIGLLAPEDFQEILEKELFLDKDKAEKIAQEINQLIFYPVKTELEQLKLNKGDFEQKEQEEDIVKENLPEETNQAEDLKQKSEKDFSEQSDSKTEEELVLPEEEPILGEELIKMREKYGKKNKLDQSEKQAEIKQEIKKKKPKKPSKNDSYRESIE